MIDILIFFIGASIVLYVLLGGSDYGAGIIELLPCEAAQAERQKHVINEAMGPVWEANHMWLILLVVILFTGFPTIFTTLMVALHLPMLALLLGIVVRGAAFTFRHYDAIQDGRSQRIYTWLFGLSSLWTAGWLGIIAASLHRGLIDPAGGATFFSAYVAPWWGLYPLAAGGFVACIFAFLASIYLIAETDDTVLRWRFTRLAAVLNGLVLVSGGLLVAASLDERRSLPTLFAQTPHTYKLLAAVGLLFVGLWFTVPARRGWLTRVVAGGQVALILVVWMLLHAPNAVTTASGHLSFHEQAAPAATLRQLVGALLVGSLFIFPSLLFLLWVFKGETHEVDQRLAPTPRPLNPDERPE